MHLILIKITYEIMTIFYNYEVQGFIQPSDKSTASE